MSLLNILFWQIWTTVYIDPGETLFKYKGWWLYYGYYENWVLLYVNRIEPNYDRISDNFNDYLKYWILLNEHIGYLYKCMRDEYPMLLRIICYFIC